MNRKPFKWTSLEVKMQVINSRLSGIPLAQVAAEHNLHVTTVSRICTKFRKMAPDLDEDRVLGEWKEDLKAKAIEAISEALCDPTNPYRRAKLAMVVLDGLGWPTECEDLTLPESAVQALTNRRGAIPE